MNTHLPNAIQQQSQIITLISEQLGISEHMIRPECSLVSDLGADSLDEIEIVMYLEDEFGIEIDDERAERVKTVADAFALVAELVGRKA